MASLTNGWMDGWMDGMWFTPLLHQVWPAKYGCDSFSLSKLEINFFLIGLLQARNYYSPTGLFNYLFIG
jgi:hypothetical protein